MMNIFLLAIASMYLSYGLWLANTYRHMWRYTPMMKHRYLFSLLLLGLSLAWPVIVPISYIELLKEQTRLGMHPVLR